MDLLFGVVVYVLIASAIAIVASIVGIFVINWIAKNIKLIVSCMIAVGIFLAALAVLPRIGGVI